MSEFSDWLANSPLLYFGLLVVAAAALAAVGGYFLQRNRRAAGPDGQQQAESQQGYIVSAALGLLALLLGFTYSLAIDRYETRRTLVVEEANAIGTVYLRTQLLGEPHRARISRLLIQYTDNRIALAKARPGTLAALLVTNDRLITDLWAAEMAAFDSIRNLSFASVSVQAMNDLIDLDSARKAARSTHVPSEVFAALFVYIMVTAGMLGYALTRLRSRLSAIFLFALIMLSLLLVMDIDRPTMGGIRETQGPMENTRATLTSQPSSVFDRYRASNAEASGQGAK